MPSSIRTLIGAAMLAMANGQAVILSAKGDSGTSLGLQGENDRRAPSWYVYNVYTDTRHYS